MVPLGKIVAVVNLDTVGASVIPGYSPSFALGAEFAAPDLRATIHANNEPAKYVVRPVSSFFDGSKEGAGRSDHLPFRDAKVPTIWYGSGSPPEYHTPADELGIVDMKKVTGLTRHALLTAADLANGAARPALASKPKPHIDDAVALLEMGKKVRANPAAVGLDPDLVFIVDKWLEKLQDYIDKPPQTDEQWIEYDAFVKGIIKTVYSFLPGR